MKALVFQRGRAKVAEVPPPRIRPGFARVRVTLSGICNTDLELLRGYHGFSGIPGHEFVGMVEGPAGSPWLGRRVVGEINLGCGKCDFCAKDLSRHCRKRRVLGILGHPGAHAESLTLPESNLREVPADLETTLDRTLDRIAKRAGFARVQHRLDLVGLCADCAATA